METATAQGHVPTSFGTYWITWLILLVLTVFMVFLGNPAVLLGGMAIKAGIIFFWFMHLRYEKLGLVLSVLIGIFATAFVLFALTAADGRAM